ncbi:allantoinase [Pararhizobium capsulatum DSM 1112]|uniref:Allantoinase n=1 Tax=Pararhizobium capsulatum DSM 1112 TaxID=1121113 RepID=A0ABU0C0S7_9HYPH|nr:amidohydrolase family protein [Pararhizobium capsulatum]MDQ0323768.1 allantoinase [Pararhizobium capsulatum DSM 1112]
MLDLIVRGRVVTPEGILEDGWVAVSGGRIDAVGTGQAPDAAQIHDAGQSYVMPGVVDGQTHAGSYLGLPGIEPTTRSAIAGGVTTIVDMPYDNPEPLSTPAHLAAKVEAIGRYAHANVALYATVMPGQPLDDIKALANSGVVAFKISAFESSPTRFPRINAALTLDLLDALSDTDLPLGLHNEDQEIVRSRVERARAAGLDGIAVHSQSRPPAAELASTAHFLELAAAVGTHAHIVHISLPRGFRLVENYRDDGYRATGETCVHYFWFDPERDGAELGARMKVNPPIRPGMIDAMWREVMSGRVAFVSSDHSSWPIDNKFTDTIFDAGAGVPGIETLLPAFYTVAKAKGADAIRLTVEQLCERPARFFGLSPRKGAIVAGADADLTIFEEADVVWDSANAEDGLRWSPYDGRRFTGRVAGTFLAGRLAYDGTRVLNRPGDGHYAARGPISWFTGETDQ